MIRGLFAYSLSLIGMLATLSSLEAAVDAPKAELNTAIRQATSEHKHDKQRCATLGGNAKEVCLAEAESRHMKARADAIAREQNTAPARIRALEQAADADFLVAKAKCGAFLPKDKAVCLEEAQAKQVKTKADAKESTNIAALRTDLPGARRDASQENTDAQFKVALQKCGTMSGRAKDDCIGEARAKFGKN